MSLKAFHILFISISALMFLGLGVWLFANFFRDGGTWTAVLAGLSVAVASGLVVYGRAFLRKLRHLSYL